MADVEALIGFMEQWQGNARIDARAQAALRQGVAALREQQAEIKRLRELLSHDDDTCGDPHMCCMPGLVSLIDPFDLERETAQDGAYLIRDRS